MAFSKLLKLSAVATAGALTLAGCGTTDSNKSNGGNASGEDCAVTVGFMGPLTGDDANLGANVINGVKLAQQDYKGKCKITLKEMDSEGNAEKATSLASELIKDKDAVALIGPMWSGETNATGAAFAEAGLVTVSPSATRVSLSENGWDTFHRVLGNDGVQAPAAGKYMRDTLKLTKAFVVDDATDYGKPLADGVAQELGDLVVQRDTVQKKQTDFSALVTKIKDSGADGLFYSGYYSEAGLLLKQLRAGGWQGAFVSGDGSKDNGFIETAGPEAAEGAHLTCPCAPAGEDFTLKYTKLANQEPGTYSTEGYDAANVIFSGIAEGKTTREDLLEWVNNYDAQGLSKHIKFTKEGEASVTPVFVSTVTGGKIVAAGEVT